MKNKDIQVIKKIISYCDDVASLLKQYGESHEKYLTDISFQYSCNMCIIQIGELVGRISDEVRSEYSDIPWGAIKRMRNLHAHDYENVDLDIVWITLTEEIPVLKKNMQYILLKKELVYNAEDDG